MNLLIGTFWVLILIVSAEMSRCRDPWKQPFNSESIWNAPIGTGAVFGSINLFNATSPTDPRGPPAQFHADVDWTIILPEDYLSSVSNVTWLDSCCAFPSPNCDDNNCCLGFTHAHAAASLPLPFDFTTDCYPNNNPASVLFPSGAVVQMQPLYRPHPGKPFMAWYRRGAPNPFPWTVELHGNGSYGAHGGSGLSALGGTLRQGELLPQAPPIRHALKIELWSKPYYYGGARPLQRTDPVNGGRVRYVWPAIGSDSGTEHGCAEGGLYCGEIPYLAPGSLLAVPSRGYHAVLVQLRTELGRRLLFPFTYYGAYIVDDTGSQSNGAALTLDQFARAEVLAAYNISLFRKEPLTSSTLGMDFYWDLVTIYRNLQVVVNNAAHSVGGGGTPLQPLAPPLCPLLSD